MNTLRTTLLVLLVSSAAVPVAIAQAGGDAPTATAATDPVRFGMDAASIAAQRAAGVPADYGTMWLGPWTLSSGWGGPDAQLTAMRNAGVTPAIHYYYWGDDITPSCVEDGCWSSLHNAQKTREGWQLLAQQMVDHLDARMGGAPVVVFLESEFNKGGIQTYEPFDEYLAKKAAFIKAGYPAAEVVLAFGNWGSTAWGTFDRAAAASDYVGIQGMRGSTRQSLADMGTLYEGLLGGAKALQAKFPGKPVFVTDVAVSSHPEPDYLKVQADVLAEVFQNLPALKAQGVEAIVYRSWKDSPNMDLANYYGEAERHWGLAWASSGVQKASAQVWVDGVKAERSGAATPAPPPPPPAPLDATFTPTRNQNEWWVEVAVAANNPIAKVEASVDGGAAQALARTSWGTYAKSMHAPRGSMVAFTATDTAGQTDASEPVQWIGAKPQPPTAAFTAAMDGLTGSFDASASSDPEGAPLAYAWAFGDGATASGVRAQHVFAAGSHTVTLTVSDGGLSATAAQAVEAIQPNRPPVASFTATPAGLDAAFDAAASADPDGDALAFAWDFGDGAQAVGATARHAYAAPGTYTVTLTVSDGQLADARSAPLTAVQPNRAPVAAIATAASGLAVSADAGASTDADGDALTFAWGFGDGATASGAKASHTYAAAGTYTVTVTVSDGQAQATASRAVTVTAPPPPPAPTPPPSPAAAPIAKEGEAFATRTAGGALADSAASGGKAWNLWSKGSMRQSFALQAGEYDLAIRAKGTTASGVRPHMDVYVGGAKVLSADPGTSYSDHKVRVKAAGPVELTIVYTNDVRTTREDRNLIVDKATFTPVAAQPAPAFTAAFTPKAVGNDWWVEAAVTASEKVAKVEARVNGGAWVQLPATSWGTYAKSIAAPDGAKVEFRATSASGATATKAFTW